MPSAAEAKTRQYEYENRGHDAKPTWLARHHSNGDEYGQRRYRKNDCDDLH